MADSIDFSLYLVTGRDLLPPGKNYLESLEESLQGGVTVVQVREKSTDTGEFLQIAQQTQALCTRYNVPLIINDRIDIALAVNARGVHLGQSDMPIALARRLLRPGSIIGLSCNTKNHVRAAREDGADYVGIGAVWSTQTKKLTSDVVGVRRVGEMLRELDGTTIKAVGIGGIKLTNALRTLHGSVSTTGHALDGIAVVSDIVASSEPRLSARKLSELVDSFKRKSTKPLYGLSVGRTYTSDGIKRGVACLLADIKKINPLVHQITNNVAMNQSANATLALGASPIMATAPQEMEDLSKVSGALLINFGTVTDKEGMLLAGKWANARRKPVIFDPVGVGATAFRRTTANELLNTWQASVIKGNAGELGALANSTEVQAKGVDSIGSGFADPASFVRDLARKERCPVVLTGAVDWVSDGATVVRLSNGHALLGAITGSGCVVGTCVATFCAAAHSTSLKTATNEADDDKLVKGDMFLGAIGGVLALSVAGEIAAERQDVQGSGTFLPALIDALYNLTPEVLKERANVEVVVL